MIYTSYCLTANDIVIKLPEGLSIPADPVNTDYAAYLIWLSEGNIPEPYVPPPAPPVTEVTALQGLLAIDHAGLSVEYTVWANSPLRTFAQKAFIDKAQTWKRNDPTLIAAATDLGLSDGQLDALFTLASNL